MPLVHRIRSHTVSHGGTVGIQHTYTILHHGPMPARSIVHDMPLMRGTLQAPPPETVAGINFSSPAFAPATDAVRP